VRLSSCPVDKSKSPKSITWSDVHGRVEHKSLDATHSSALQQFEDAEPEREPKARPIPPRGPTPPLAPPKAGPVPAGPAPKDALISGSSADADAARDGWFSCPSPSLSAADRLVLTGTIGLDPYRPRSPPHSQPWDAQLPQAGNLWQGMSDSIPFDRSCCFLPID
jgi:hypothetical protein